MKMKELVSQTDMIRDQMFCESYLLVATRWVNIRVGQMYFIMYQNNQYLL